MFSTKTVFICFFVENMDGSVTCTAKDSEVTVISTGGTFIFSTRHKCYETAASYSAGRALTS